MGLMNIQLFVHPWCTSVSIISCYTLCQNFFTGIWVVVSPGTALLSWKTLPGDPIDIIVCLDYGFTNIFIHLSLKNYLLSLSHSSIVNCLMQMLSCCLGTDRSPEISKCRSRATPISKCSTCNFSWPRLLIIILS